MEHTDTLCGPHPTTTFEYLLGTSSHREGEVGEQQRETQPARIEGRASSKLAKEHGDQIYVVLPFPRAFINVTGTHLRRRRNCGKPVGYLRRSAIRME
jgi:hypothetical protein